MHGRMAVSAGRKGRSRGLTAAAGLAAGMIALVGVSGCAKMDAAMDKQWMVVDFNPGTTVATALQVRAACSHVQDTPPMALPPKRSVINIMYGVRYDTTNSSPANLAQLQTCLQKFPSVQGVDPEDVGDEGS
ncbi:MAG: hypothetical protein WAK71_17985 [Streptosporangiaceae bacterium]